MVVAVAIVVVVVVAVASLVLQCDFCICSKDVKISSCFAGYVPFHM